MRRNSAGLAIATMLFVVLACSFGKKASVNTNQNASSDKSVSDSASATGAISEIHMAKDDGSGDPGQETTIFSGKDRTIHCVTKLKDAEKGTKMKFSWWVVDASGSQNEKIKDIDYTTGALENIVHGHLTAPRDWPQGKYKVEVYVNGNLEKTTDFTVE